MIKVALVGATGWTGKAIAHALHKSSDFEFVAAVARTSAGKDLGEVLEGKNWGVPIFGDVKEAIANADVMIEYTGHATVKAHTLIAISHRVHVVVGSSGMSADDFLEIECAAKEKSVGVIAAGNYALTAALAQAAAVMVAKHLPHWEVIDYASKNKPDVPSGTARELAEKLSAVRRPEIGVSVKDIAGPKEARGADIDGTQVHSIRLPSFVVSTEVIFGLPDQRLSIRFDAGSSAEPYVDGTLLAAKAVIKTIGLTRGLEDILLK